MDTYRSNSPSATQKKIDALLARASTRDKIIALVTTLAVSLLAIKLLVKDHDVLFLLAEFVHFIGIGFLAYKLLKHKNCAGLSLKTQQLTATFLSIRLYCSLVMEYDLHTLLDTLTLVATLWVCRMMQTSVRTTYNEVLDPTPLALIVGPCVGLAIFAHPTTKHLWFNRVLWATCVYLEAVSVLPQLRVMQSAKVVERWTANYVFSLGVARFLSCAHWILQIFDGQSYLKTALTTGLWPVMVLGSEFVQTFILADFCYFYVLSFADGGKVVRLPAGLV